MAQKHMKKTLSKFIAAALVLVLALSLVGFAPADAAETPEVTSTTSEPEKASPYHYYHLAKDYTKTFTGEAGNQIIVESYVNRVVLVGFGDSIKKINKSLKKIASGFYKNCNVEGAYEYAKSDVDQGKDLEIYTDYVYMGVTYTGTKYVSIVSENVWYVGGVTNIFDNGLVYDLDTGKRKTITAVTGLKLDEIKEKFIESVKNSQSFGEYYDEYADSISAYVDTMTAKDINFIIDSKGQISIFIPPYTDPFFGGIAKTFALDGVYVAE